ncbi:AAA family ATPase [Providencia rettgeri]|uniref:AAA family ATPase n=1 Tax=Providencia sp. PROV169 TaxID=2949875 RepID=UPI0023499384|nr:AAA family ATPase [Providencia sp. PROV169]
MYLIERIEIQDFWGRFNATCNFNDDVNIIIGKNGTGKTTFMNILNSILAVDLDSIVIENFKSADIYLQKENKEITEQNSKDTEETESSLPDTVKISVKILEDESDLRLSSLIEYNISGERYNVRLAPNQRQLPLSIRTKILESKNELKKKLNKLVSLSSLSVYRLRSGEDLELRNSNSSEYINPVDYRLMQLLQNLMRYQLTLSQHSRIISSELQKDVLTSILYAKGNSNKLTLNIEFNKESESRNLITAFSRLNAYDESVRRKIINHVDTIDKTLKAIHEEKERLNKDKNYSESFSHSDIDYRSIEAYFKTQQIIRLSLEAEEKINNIYSLLNLFLKIIHEFIDDKNFTYDEGELKVNGKYGEIGINNLSSGEKQLLILLIETLLQQGKSYIFLADEPELSLHIAWQRKIIPAIKRLNPNAQVIAATHSPEVASRFKNNVVNMGNIVHE